jgi:hypothetical protein
MLWFYAACLLMGGSNAATPAIDADATWVEAARPVTWVEAARQTTWEE